MNGLEEAMLPKLPEFPWYQRDPSMEDVAEYGRQCWNAALEAVANTGCYESDFEHLKLPVDTVSPTE
jgi:hypothetical protein